MDEVPSEPPEASAGDLCARCLQPVPPRASRCPGCGQPHHSWRHLPLMLGVAGIFALAFVMTLMYYAAGRADMMNEDVPVVDEGAKQEIMVDTPDTGGKPAQPDKPEKKPPLNE